MEDFIKVVNKLKISTVLFKIVLLVSLVSVMLCGKGAGIKFACGSGMCDEYGSFVVRTDQTNVDVYLEGYYIGSTSNFAVVSSGTIVSDPYRVKLIKPGYQEYETVVNVPTGGQCTQIYYEMVPLKRGEVLRYSPYILSLTTYPSDAKIYIDGTFRGKTNTIIKSILTGSHTITLTLKDYLNKSANIIMEPGKNESISYNLEKLPDTGAILIHSNPENAEIYLDGRLKGITGTMITDIKPGSRTITISKYGYHSWSSTVNVSAGEPQTINAA